MDDLDPLQKLDGDQEDGLESELFVAGGKELLEVGAEKFHDESIVLAAAGAVVVDLREPDLRPQQLVEPLTN